MLATSLNYQFLGCEEMSEAFSQKKKKRRNVRSSRQISFAFIFADKKMVCFPSSKTIFLFFYNFSMTIKNTIHVSVNSTRK